MLFALSSRAIFLWLCSKDLNELNFTDYEKLSPEENLMNLKNGQTTYARVYETLCRSVSPIIIALIAIIIIALIVIIIIALIVIIIIALIDIITVALIVIIIDAFVKVIQIIM